MARADARACPALSADTRDAAVADAMRRCRPAFFVGRRRSDLAIGPVPALWENRGSLLRPWEAVIPEDPGPPPPGIACSPRSLHIIEDEQASHCRWRRGAGSCAKRIINYLRAYDAHARRAI